MYAVMVMLKQVGPGSAQSSRHTICHMLHTTLLLLRQGLLDMGRSGVISGGGANAYNALNNSAVKFFPI
jgi:hypothetical protein